MTPGQLRRRRTQVQLLGARPRTDEPVPLVRNLLAVQAQDFPAARLALRARGLRDGAALHAALESGALRIGWLLRGTLHLVTDEDYRVLLSLTGPRAITANQRRLRQLGVTPAQADLALTVVRDALGTDGPLTRAELGGRLQAAGVPVEGQALPHLLLFAALNHVLALGPVRAGSPAYVRLARVEPPGRDAALAELARRYLAAHAPADDVDLAAWSGLPLGDVRAGLAAPREPGPGDGPGGRPGQSAGEPVGEPAPPSGVRLLPAFDPYLLGWKDRAFLVDDRHRRSVYPGGGVIRATVTLDGRAAGTWGLRRGAAGLHVRCALFAGVPSDALRAEAEDVARFEGVDLDRLDVAGPGDG